MHFVSASARSTNRKRLARRAALLTGAATLSMGIAGGARAQETVFAREGQTIQGPIQLSDQNDRLIVDISRIRDDGTLILGANNGQPALTSTETIDNPGGHDYLWLAASGQETRTLLEDDVAVDGFTAGIVYEAYGANSVLTLNSPVGQSFDETLQLGGNGTINLTISQAPIAATSAIQVIEGGTAQLFDNAPGRLTLNLSGAINGTDADAHIDVQHAGQLNLIGAGIDIRRGMAIYATDQAVTIDAQSWVRAKHSDSLDVQDATLIYLDGEGSVTNHGQIVEQGDVGGPGSVPGKVAIGVQLNGGGTLHNARTSATSFGRISMYGNAVQVTGRGGTIINDGLIQSAKTVDQQETYAAIASYDLATAILRNNASGTVQGIITNTNGDDLGHTIAYEGGDGADIVVNAGTIKGDVSLGGDDEINREAWKADVFLAAGTGTVVGQIDGGEGDHDAYGRSFSSTGSYEASNTIGTAQTSGFERHGIEAYGAGVTATFTSSEVLANGLTVLGDATVVNQADITLAENIGIVVHDAARGVHFVNDTDAVVNVSNGRAFKSDGDGLASFINRGSFLGESLLNRTGAVEIVADDKPEAFVFQNSGSIAGVSASALYLRVRGDTTTFGGDLDFTNSGRISGGRAGADIDVYSRGHATLRNSGIISGFSSGVRLNAGALTAINSGIVRSHGTGSTAFSVDSPQTAIENRHIIEVTGAGEIDGDRVYLSAGLVVGLNSGGEASITNGAGGVISATQESSVAVAADGIGISSFAFTNSGRVLGSGIDTSAARLSADSRVFFEGTVASAIHTNGTRDQIVNQGAGLIQGNVDLGQNDDRFEARDTSRLEGDLRMGTEDDILLWAGGTISGIASGGDGDDTIRVDLSAERTLDGDRVRSFETIAREGNGTSILNLLGTFDVSTINLQGMTVRIQRDHTLNTAGAVNLTGSDAAERVIIDGNVTGSIATGAGADRVELSGTGRVGGGIDLGEGDDYLDLGTGAFVSGAIDGGAGANDTLGIRLLASQTGAPAFAGFEAYEVRGNHRLTLDGLTGINGLSLLEGADLTISDAAGSTAQLTGDGSAQDVVITGTFAGGINLGAGNDTLTMNNFSGTLTGALDGGADIDALNLHLTGDTTFGNGAVGFETINVTGTSSLTIDGDFAAGQTLNFGADDNSLIIAQGATFSGTVIDAGGVHDAIRIDTGAPATRTVVSGQIQGFEHLDANGTGTLALTGGNYSFATVDVSGGNLALGANTALVLTDADGLDFDGADNRLTLSSGARITGAVDAGERAGDRDMLAFQQGAGQVSRLGDFGLSSLVGFEQMAVLGAGAFHIDRNLAAFDQVVLEGGNLVVDAGSTLDADVLGRDVADPAQAATDDTLSVLGIVAGNVSLGGGNDIVDNRGRIEGNVDLGAGDDEYIARDGGVVTGTIDGGAGDNTFTFRLGSQNGTIPGNVVNFNSLGVFGPGTLEISLAPTQRYENFLLREGANLTITEDRGGSIGNIIGDDSAQVVTIGSTLTGGVNLGGGNDILNLTLNGTLSGALVGGENADASADNDVLNLTLTGASTVNGMNEFETVNVTGTAALTMAGTIGDGQSINFVGTENNHLILAASATLQGVVDGGAGTDLLEVETGGADRRTVVTAQIRNFENLVANGSGTLVLLGGNYGFGSVTGNGNLTLGAGVVLTAANGVTFGDGDNRLTVASGADIQGAVNAGGGNDTLALSQAEGFTRAISDLDVTGFERLETSGAGTLRIDRSGTYSGGVAIDGGTTIVTDSAQLTGSIIGGANADTLEVFGHVTGNVDLGAGNDRLVVGSLTGIRGSVQGGDGTDTVVFDTDATYAAPVVLAGEVFDGFESLGVRRGVVSLTGTSEWTDVTVSGGRLIGQAGSTLTAGQVTVAAGATFGSAGIVNADIDVLGTLSPGASPGTMTVNGDVTMRTGSNLLIELTPTAGRDLLDVNGTLTIANGAAMDITGALGNVPGSVLDIVVADTITGRFTTINKSASVFGFVVQNGNRIQIRSEFNNSDTYPTNIQSSVGYSNQVLRDSYGVQAYTAALGVLTAADGTINQRAFAQLTPEAYGSAMQLGIENGLQLVDAGRALTLTAPRANGLYGFAQGLTGDSDIAGQADTGASRADLRSHGLLGGIGYGMGEGRLRLGAFVGRSDIDQRLTALDATTDAKGFFGGVFADAAIGGVGLHAMVSYSDLDAETRRRLAVSSTPATSDYGLKSWVADMRIDYSVRLGGIDVTPKAGLSHVRTRRGAVTEQGAGDFALAVRGDHASAWFGDAGVAVSGTTQLGGVGLTPYAEVGVRRQLNQSEILVSGSYDGAPGAPIVVHGVERDRTVGRFGLGLGIDAGQNLRFRLGYTGEFDNTRRSSITAGASFRF